MKDPLSLRRQRAYLKSLGILDGPTDTVYEFIVHTLSDTLHVPVCLISIIDDLYDRQFLLASTGLEEILEDARGIPLSHSICQHVRDHDTVLKFEDIKMAAQLHWNCAAQDLGVQAYAGAPIKGSDKLPIGAICAMDQVPRIWSERDLGYLEGFAEIVSRQIALSASLHTLELVATGQKARGPGAH